MEFIISFLSEWGYLALFICMVLEYEYPYPQ